MPMKLTVQGREAVSSASVVLGADDREVRVDLEGVVFAIRLEPGDGDLEIGFLPSGVKFLTIIVRGRLPEGGAAWKVTGVGRDLGVRVDLDLFIYSLNSTGTAPRMLTYTFTAVRE